MYATTFIIPSTINTTANNITAVDNAIPGFAIKNIALGYSLPSTIILILLLILFHIFLKILKSFISSPFSFVIYIPKA